MAYKEKLRRDDEEDATKDMSDAGANALAYFLVSGGGSIHITPGYTDALEKALEQYVDSESSREDGINPKDLCIWLRSPFVGEEAANDLGALEIGLTTTLINMLAYLGVNEEMRIKVSSRFRKWAMLNTTVTDRTAGPKGEKMDGGLEDTEAGVRALAAAVAVAGVLKRPSE